MARERIQAVATFTVLAWALASLPLGAQEGTLSVLKEVSPVTDDTVFPFTIEGDGGDINFDLLGGEFEEFTLEPGTYVVRETVPEEWELSLIRCGDLFEVGPVASGALQIALGPGDSVLCQFENTMIGVPPPPPPPALSIPALSPTGLAVSFILIAALGTFALRRYL